MPMCLLYRSYDFANSVYSVVVITLMGPLLVNSQAKQKIYGDLRRCNATADVIDANYTSQTYTIQNYNVNVLGDNCAGGIRECAEVCGDALE